MTKDYSPEDNHRLDLAIAQIVTYLLDSGCCHINKRCQIDYTYITPLALAVKHAHTITSFILAERGGNVELSSPLLHQRINNSVGRSPAS